MARTTAQVLSARNLAARRQRDRFKGAASVSVIRYRYRGYRIPTPWTPSAPTG
ncbi:hypothetical protein [Arthrobacter sp. ISL-72]|uniref:hypothetical protein n=1 Tax=Arthrobacter sp. ISL-72 TaxID=2819114 RepID=UPI0020356693|nr:hypothetical protein [Arthrobacter sp. ISL-72]